MKKKPDRRFVIAILALVAGAASTKGVEFHKAANASGGSSAAPPAVTKLITGAS
jgi:hypothetical protein